MIYQFENFELDTALHELRRGENTRRLEPLTFSLLVYLISNHSRVVSKDDINTNVWKGRIVSDAALSSCIHAARAALDDSGSEQRLIKTVHGKGFRFIGALTISGDNYTSEDTRTPAVQDANLEDMAPPKHSIAVLPFDNMGSDEQQDHFSDGMCEDIITALAKIPKLFVVSRNSSFAFRDTAFDIRKVGRELGVRYVLEGSVRKNGNVLRVTGQLIDVHSGGHVWAERYDRTIDDLFELQDEMTREIVSALHISLTVGEKARLWSSGTRNYQAWENLLRGRFLVLSYDKDNSKLGRELIEQAVELDENYASAKAWLAYTYLMSALFGWEKNSQTTVLNAKALADKAHSLEPNNSDALSILSFITLFMHEHEQALILAKQAVGISPNDAMTLASLGSAYYYTDEWSLAAKHMRKGLAHAQDFYNIIYPTIEALAYFQMEQYDRAYETIKKAIAKEPDFAVAQSTFAMVCIKCNKPNEAKAAMSSALALNPNMSIQATYNTLPYQNPKTLAHLIKYLREAGMPE